MQYTSMILLRVPLAKKKLQQWSQRLPGNFVSTKVVGDVVIVIVPGLLLGKDAFLLFAHKHRRFFAPNIKLSAVGNSICRRLFADAVILIATYLLSGECVPFPSPPIAKECQHIFAQIYNLLSRQVVTDVVLVIASVFF